MRVCLVTTLVALLIVVGGVVPANAAIVVDVIPDFPPTAQIGSSFQASLIIRNGASGESVDIFRINVFTACPRDIPVCAPDVGVFTLSTTGVGAPGPQSCLGTWTIPEIAGGVFRFAPPAGEGTLQLAPGDACEIRYLVSARRLPTVDHTPPSPPVDTGLVAVVEARVPSPTAQGVRATQKVPGFDSIAVFPPVTPPQTGTTIPPPVTTVPPGPNEPTVTTLPIIGPRGILTTVRNPVTTATRPNSTVPTPTTSDPSPTTTIPKGPGSRLPAAWVAVGIATLLLVTGVLLWALPSRTDDSPPIVALPVASGGSRGPRTHSEVADDALGRMPVPPLAAAGPAAARIADACGSDDVATPLIATLLWDTFLTDDRLGAALRMARASSRAIGDGRFVIVRHAEGTRHDLLVFDPGFSGDPAPLKVDLLPSVHTAPNRRTDLVWHDLLVSEQQGPWPSLDESTILAALREAAQGTEFGLVVAKPPRVLMTACPSPARAISLGHQARATMGTVVEAPNGSLAATTVLHAIKETDDDSARTVQGRSVNVGDQSGTVLCAHEATDSCLVAVRDFPLEPGWPGLAGPLSGITPRQNERTKFDGIASGARTTTITSWDPSILHRQYLLGSKVYTTPDIIQGDSGAALIDKDDHILGYAVYRSAFGEPIVEATWVWAAQVFAALGARMLGREPVSK